MVTVRSGTHVIYWTGKKTSVKGPKNTTPRSYCFRMQNEETR
jgi:hypothetical protein